MDIFLVTAERDLGKNAAVKDYKQKILRRKLKMDCAQLVGPWTASNFSDVG
jgi:hypothetical protein